MEKEQADQILAALPWRCFQCDFVTSDPEEASAHFGDRDDGEEFKPICKWWDRMEDDRERIATLQSTIRDADAQLQRALDNEREIEVLEIRIQALTTNFQSFKPFRNCTTANEAFFVYDSLEGRLLAAQERERVLVEAVNDAGFKVMLSDDGKTFLKRDLPTISVPASCWPGNEPLA